MARSEATLAANLCDRLVEIKELYGTYAEVARRYGDTVRTPAISRKSFENLISKRAPITGRIREAIERFIRQESAELDLHWHRGRWTGLVLPGALHHKGVDAAEFRQNLRTAISLRDGFPRRVAFVSHTGQWLKPVLRPLLREHAVNVEVYVCDPARTRLNSSGRRDTAQIISVLEFFWSLPVCLSLDRVLHESRLDIYTYDGSTPVNRLAYFEGNLVGFSKTGNLSSDLQSVRGHPAIEDEAPAVDGPQNVEITLVRHRRFDVASSEVAKRLHDGSEPLSGVQHRVSWTRNGFSGFDKFSIDPKHYLGGERRPGR